MSKKINIIILLCMAIIVIGCTSTEQESTNEEIVPENEANKSHELTEIINCNSDINCFIEQSRTCKPSIWHSQYGTSFEIKGERESKCWIYRDFMDDECPFEIAELTNMLSRWKQLHYSTEDWDSCEQKYKVG